MAKTQLCQPSQRRAGGDDRGDRSELHHDPSGCSAHIQSSFHYQGSGRRRHSHPHLPGERVAYLQMKNLLTRQQAVSIAFTVMGIIGNKKYVI
jgi:hypothetical protein